MGRWQVIENVRLSDIISVKEVVAEDVFGKQTNLRLVRAGTVLTNNIIGKLLLHGVNYVRIGDAQTRIQLDDSTLTAPVTDTKEFRQFVTNYDGMLTAIRQEVASAIFEGEVKRIPNSKHRIEATRQILNIECIKLHTLYQTRR